MFGIDDIAMITGGIGMVKGLFEDSPEYKAPTFADIDLQSINPELWRELQKQSALADQAESLYTQRRQGATYGERADMEQAMSGVLNRQANMGQLGSAVGQSQAISAENALRAQIAERAFREQQSLQAQAMQARGSYLNNFQNAQQMSMAPMQDQARMDYQSQMDEQSGQNKFFGGILNAGLGMYAQNQNMAAMKDIAAQNPYLSYAQQTGPRYSGPMAYPQQNPWGGQ